MDFVSLFDGMSCGQEALVQLGYTIDRYRASEIDKYAMKVTKKNHPNTEFIGKVQDVKITNSPFCLFAGSPCQGFSFAGKQLNFNDPRSSLFFEFIRIKEECNPKWWLLENVPMKKEFKDIISKYCGVEPIKINSALVSAQNRKRWYWTNIPNITQPEDKEIYLKDVLAWSKSGGKNADGSKRNDHRVRTNGKANTLLTSVGGNIGNNANWLPNTADKIEDFLHTQKAIDYMNRTVKGGRDHWAFKHHSDSNCSKSAALVANLFKGVPYNVLLDEDVIRKLTPIECERLQTLPDNYTEGVSNTQRYKMIGNGWTVDVIAHILSHIPK